MYHIPRDARAWRSARKLAVAVAEMLKSTPLQKITVSALCERAGIARSTFYRSFDHVEDVVKWRLSAEVGSIAERIPRHLRDGEEREKSCRGMISRLSCESSLLRALARDSRPDLLGAAFSDEAATIAERLNPRALSSPSSLRRYAREGASFTDMMVMLRFDRDAAVSQQEWLSSLVAGITSGFRSWSLLGGAATAA